MRKRETRPIIFKTVMILTILNVTVTTEFITAMMIKEALQ